MRTTVHRWWFVWDFEKEEKWLNDMAAQGLALVSTGFLRYEFEPCEPGEYIVRLEYMAHRPRSAEGRQYIEFLESTGAEHLGSYGRWVFFRKRTELGPFDIYSDLDSRIAHLRRIQPLLLILGLLNLALGLQNVLLAFGDGVGFNHVGFVNLALGLLLFYGAYRFQKKIRRLKQERQVFE
ncbi:MAG: DUF2812 domain-containing protein [Oscillospiraceae bacterium]|nr:DUF2812 domain-containing protein [Oscillospiraceae bacterium]